MVIQKTVDSLKDKPKDEKKAIAGGIAILVVAVLIVAWGFFFLKKVQRGAQLQQIGGAPDEFMSSSMREARNELMKSFEDIDALMEARDQSSRQYQPIPIDQGAFDVEEQFGGAAE